MGKNIDYTKLYKLQDSVLEIFKKCDTTFYLTGGTCLNRFIAPRRFSDYLDFFCHDNSLFRDYIRGISAALKLASYELITNIDSRDFVRITLNNELKIDFVNDRVYRHGSNVISPQGFSIDNTLNILANKITAVVDRDEAKDMFDITTFRQIMKINWNEALDIALKKSVFEIDHFVYRIQSFPFELLDHLSVIKPEYLDECKKTINIILNELKNIDS